MRTRTGVAVFLLSGLTWLGVPSAAADELPPNPAETSAVTAPAVEPPPAPTLAPSEIATTEPEPQAEESAAQTGEPAPPIASEATPAPAEEATGELTGAVDLTQPVGEPDYPETVEEGDAAGIEQAPALAEETLAAAAEELIAPRASIGDVDCTNLTFPVTLDNSASTEALTYEYSAESSEGLEEAEVAVPGGAIRIVNVPVTEDTQVRVSVLVFLEVGPNRFLTSAFLTVDCTDDEVPYDPRAGIGGVDCAKMNVDVTLDNSRSEVEAIYQVTWEKHISTGSAEQQDDNFIVAAGDVQTFLSRVAENTYVVIRVAAERVPGEQGGSWVYLAVESLWVNCTPGDYPRVRIGEVNCTNLTVPVTLDNTRSPLRAYFRVWADYPPGAPFDELQHSFVVAGGDQHVVPVPVPNTGEVRVWVDDDDFDFRLADETFDVDCKDPAAGPAARPTVAVQGAKLPQAGGVTELPQTGGFNLALPLLGVALVAGGAGMLALSGRRRQH
jgi:LPXTG-motif cell wall-anchored protein